MILPNIIFSQHASLNCVTGTNISHLQGNNFKVPVRYVGERAFLVEVRTSHQIVIELGYWLIAHHYRLVAGMDVAIRERAEHSTSAEKVRKTEIQNLDTQLQQVRTGIGPVYRLIE